MEVKMKWMCGTAEQVTTYQRHRCKAGMSRSLLRLDASLSSSHVKAPEHFLQFTAEDLVFKWKWAGNVPLITEAPVMGVRPRLGLDTRTGALARTGDRPPEPRAPVPRTEEPRVRSGDICLGAESRITAFYHLYLLNNCRSIIALIMTKLQTLYKIHIFYKQNVEQVYSFVYFKVEL